MEAPRDPFDQLSRVPHHPHHPRHRQARQCRRDHDHHRPDHRVQVRGELRPVEQRHPGQDPPDPERGVQLPARCQQLRCGQGPSDRQQPAGEHHALRQEGRPSPLDQERVGVRLLALPVARVQAGVDAVTRPRRSGFKLFGCGGGSATLRSAAVHMNTKVCIYMYGGLRKYF